MSKLKKLVNHPSLFFRDYFDKRSGSSIKAPTPPKRIGAKAPKIQVKTPINIDLSHVNFYRSIPFIIHSGESVDAGMNQLIPWISIFSRTEVNFLLLVRNEALFKWATKNYPWLSIAYARRGVDVEALIIQLPDAKNVFYPSSTGNNIHVVRFNHLNHVFIGHGDSDKASSAHKALRLYDEIWTSGQAHIDRFKNSDFYTGHLKFLKVGKPNLYKILKNSQENWKDRISPRILYLPTWEGVVEETNYSSTHLSGQIIREVNKNLHIPISVKYHPFTGNRNSLLKNISSLTQRMVLQDNLEAEVILSGVELKNVIPLNNLYICDISGVVTECLAADAPIFVYIPSDREVKISSSNMIYSDYCYTFSSVDELLEKMQDVLQGNDYLSENRKKAMDYFIGADETLNNTFNQQLLSMSIKNNELKYVSRLFDEL